MNAVKKEAKIPEDPNKELEKDLATAEARRRPVAEAVEIWGLLLKKPLIMGIFTADQKTA